ncbi:hypothetical protein WA158_001908 [Blastocystis sp. Blastoise]
MFNILRSLPRTLWRSTSILGKNSMYYIPSMQGINVNTFARSVFTYGNPFGGQQGGSRGNPVDTKFYDLLEVSPNASQDEIKKAFRKLAMKHHPDKGGDPQTFAKIKEAYDILGNEEKRNVYDQMGEAAATQNDDGVHMSDIDLASIFESFFGGNPMGGNNGFNGGFGRGMQSTEDMVQVLPLDLEELYTGCTKTFKIRRDRICKSCHGTGSRTGKTTACRTCGGRGYIIRTIQMGGMITQSQSVCPACNGGGATIPSADLCKECHGHKIKKETEELEVVIEPGRRDGEKIILEQKSNEYPGAITGDVIFILSENPHKLFKRRGRDLLLKKKISLNEALTGIEFPLEHINGEHFTIQSHMNDIIQPFGVRLVEELGMPVYKHKNHFGNLFVQFEVEMPKKLSEKQKEAIKLVLEGKDQDFDFINHNEMKSTTKPSSNETKDGIENNNNNKKNNNETEKIFKKEECKERKLHWIFGKKCDKENNKTDDNNKKEDIKKANNDKKDETKKDDIKKEETKKEETKKEETKKEETKKDESKKEETKKEESKNDTNKNETSKKEEPHFYKKLLDNCDQVVYGSRALWDSVYNPKSNGY